MNYNFHPFNYTGWKYIENDKRVVILNKLENIPINNLPISSEWYCGYILFNLRDIPEKFRNSDININIHGGITYCHIEEDKYIVYGFDCNHWNDVSNPELQNYFNILGMVKSMELQIIKLCNIKEVKIIKKVNNPTKFINI